MAEKPSGNLDFSENYGDSSTAATTSEIEGPESHVPVSDDRERAEPSEGDDTSSNTITPTASESSSAPGASGRIDKIQQYFEADGYRVKFHGGNHFISSGDLKCVEMNDGTVFHIELSNCNDYGCDVDIRMLKLNQGEVLKTDMFLYEDVGGWRLDPRQENFAIHNSVYGQGKFVFYSSDPGKKEGDENKKNKKNMRSVFEVTFTPEAYSLYFKMRDDGNEGVLNVRIPKRPDANLRDALERVKEKKKMEEKKKMKEKYKMEENKMVEQKKFMKEKYETEKRKLMDEKKVLEEKKTVGGEETTEEKKTMEEEKEKWIEEEKRMEEEYNVTVNQREEEMKRIGDKYQKEAQEKMEEIEKYFAELHFCDGKTIFHTDKLISAIVKNQSKTNPLLRLKEKEKIFVRLDGGERKEIDVNPSNLDVKYVTEKMSDLYGEGEYQLKVSGENFTSDSLIKCLKGETVDVCRTQRGYRGVGLTRGLNFGNQEGYRGFRGSGYRGNFYDDDDDDEILSMLRGATGNDTMRNLSLPSGVGVVRYEGEPVQAFGKLTSNRDDPFITSADHKVVITVHLVSMRTTRTGMK